MTEVEVNAAPEKVIVRGVKGTVKWFSPYNHYGFINRADNGKDVFVHLSAIVQRGRIRFALDPEQEVEMDVALGSKGDSAIAVTLPGGLPVVNTRIIRFGRRENRRRNKSQSSVEAADEEKQPKKEIDDKRQAAGEKKTEGGGNKRPKKRFNRRRRGSTINDDGAQAGGDDFIYGAPKSQIAETAAEVKDGQKEKTTVDAAKPKSESTLKKDASKAVSGADLKKDASKPAAETASKKDVVKPIVESAPKKDAGKPMVDPSLKKEHEPIPEKAKTEGAKPAESGGAKKSASEAVDSKDRRQSFVQSLVSGVNKMFDPSSSNGESEKDVIEPIGKAK